MGKKNRLAMGPFRGRTVGWTSALCACLWAAQVRGADKQETDPQAVQISGEETFIAEAVGDNGDVNESLYGDDDNYSRYINRLYFKAQNARFESDLRLDTTFFHQPPYRVSTENFVPGGAGYTTLDYDNDYRLEQLHGTLKGELGSVTLGDFHVSFGRGMVLSLVKMDDLAEDNRLRGARMEYRVQRKLLFTLVGGVVNTLNADPITRQIYRDDPLDRVGGLRVEWEILDAFRIAAHGVVMKPRYTAPEQIDANRLYFDRSPGVDVLSGGGSLEAHLEGIHFYLEGNGQSHTDYRVYGADARDESGGALYGEISYDLSGFSFLAEGFFYRRWLMEGSYRGVGTLAAAAPAVYSNLVTLDVDFVPDKSVGNAAGGRLTANYFVRRIDLDLRLRCAFIKSLGGLMTTGEWNDHPPTWTVHPILEAKKQVGRRHAEIRATAGGRFEHTARPELPDVETGSLWHVSAGATVPLAGPNSLEMEGMVRHHDLQVTEGNTYYVGSISLGYDFAGRFAATAAYEYSDETTTEGNRIGDMSWLPSHHFAWLRASLKLPEVRKGLTLRIFAGSERGGVKCVGGVCRTYPDTVGVRFETALSF